MIFFFVICFFIIFTSIFIFISNLLNLNEEVTINKIHLKPAKLIGGLIIFSTIIFSQLIFEVSNYFLYILAVSFLMLSLGLLDDIFNISYIKRIFVQILIASLIIGNSININDLGIILENNTVIYLGFFTYLITLLSIIGLTNAINFIDGIDGLAASIVLNSFITIILYVYFSDYEIDNFFYTEIIIVILPILFFIFLNVSNLFKYKIFLGDSGSNFLGFFLSCFLILYTLEDNRIIHPVLAPWCVAYPVYDMLNVIIERTSNKKNPFLRDNSHLHSKLYLIFNNNQLLVLATILLISIFMSFFGLIVFMFMGPLFSLLSFVILFIPYFIINRILTEHAK